MKNSSKNIYLENLYIYIFVIILLSPLFIKFGGALFFKREYFEDDKILINILTRTGSRENCFKNLEKSINYQSYKNIRHIKSNDNNDCKFINDNDVFNVDKVKRYNHHHCPYNSYLNTLKNKVKSGWILVLDDDSKLVDNNFIKNITEKIKKEKDAKIIIFDSLIDKNKRVLPNFDNLAENKFNCNKIKYAQIDMCCMIFHHSVDIDFGDSCGGDYIFFKKALEKYNTKYVKMKPGIWANYHGGKGGSDLICEID